MQISYDEGNVVLTEVRDFDLAQTLECGQCFHFKKLAEQEYAVCAFHRLLRIRQEKDSVILFDTTMQDYEMIWRDYFDFGRDYGRIKAALLQTDDTLKEAVETMQGVHILQQEFFETLISFIISQNKQIPHIKKIVETLSERFGDDLGEINGMRFFAFPTVSQMCNVTEEDLRDCKTGFRAPYIVDAVQKTADGQISEAALKAADTAECEKMLTKIKGVGSKVANCCMLFGLDKRDAFPGNVWIKRIMEQLYFSGKETDKEKIAAFAKTRFGSYGGYAQQYLFFYGKTVRIGTQNQKIKKV